MRIRHLAEVSAEGDRAWFQPALDRLAALGRDADSRLREFFPAETPVYVARAPGRLDVMGGIADYSGASVLELPLDRSTSQRWMSEMTTVCRMHECRTRPASMA